MDDTQYVKNSHHNRNRVKGPEGLIWLTVPVYHKGKFGQKIMDVEIDNKTDWRKKHWGTMCACYSRTPYFEKYSDFLNEAYSNDWKYLVDLNIFMIKKIAGFLGIRNTEFRRLSELNVNNENPTLRLIDICEKTGATNYIIGTRARDYMQEDLWKKTNVKLEYFEPAYPAYPQLFGGFIDHCSIVDLLFNCGENSFEYIWGKYYKEINSISVI